MWIIKTWIFSIFLLTSSSSPTTSTSPTTSSTHSRYKQDDQGYQYKQLHYVLNLWGIEIRLNTKWFDASLQLTASGSFYLWLLLTSQFSARIFADRHNVCKEKFQLQLYFSKSKILTEKDKIKKLEKKLIWFDFYSHILKNEHTSFCGWNQAFIT